jgi:hypothetical protein
VLDGDLGAAGAALAASERLPALERLSVTFGAFDLSSVAALLAPRGLPGLRRLSLVSRYWDDSLWSVQPAERLLDGGLSVTVWGHGEDAITRSLPSSPVLAACRSLRIHRSMSPATTLALFRSPAAAGLRRLWLEAVPLDDEAARALAGSPHLANLRELTLAGSPIDDLSLEALLEAPFVPQLTHLNLTSAQLSGWSLQRLAEAEALGGLLELRLGMMRLPAELDLVRQRFGERLKG